MMKTIVAALLLLASSVCAFQRLPVQSMIKNSRVVVYSESPAGEAPAAVEAPKSKGFGAPQKSSSEKKEDVVKDAATLTYEAQSKRGVPEYNIFLRPLNGSDTEWVPVGSMTIPRDTKVSKAVFEVEDELIKGAFKLYPKLKAFSELRGGTVFEYGCVLKAFPDEPIEIIEKEEEEESKGFLKNWLNKITNPIDTSDLKNKNEMTMKQ